MHQEWTDRLSDYLDDELSDVEREAVESHLHDCAACAAVLNDLKRVVARARTVESRPPQADLWTGIADRLDRPGGAVMPFPRREGRRVAFTLPQLAAAAALLMAVSGGVAWQLQTARALRTGADSRGAGRLAASAPRRPDPLEAGVGLENVSMADAQYDAAVTDLEVALRNGRGRLDAATIATVEHNLQIIDQAISQARDALAADPANSYLSSHLVETRRRKLDLLRRATALTTDGN